MTKNRAKDKISMGFSMASVNHHIREIIKVRPLEEAKERSVIMEEINKIAWKITIRSKESNRINWHYARRYKKTKEQLEKLLTDMKIEYVYQQAGGTE